MHFGKDQKENISNEDERDLKNADEVYLNFDESIIKSAIKIGSIVEVKNS